VDDAIRYYHSSIYGAWTADPDQNRRRARFELIEFLLQENALPQAQAELMALAQVLPPDAAQHVTVARLFARAHDARNALAQYEVALKLDSKNVDALRGAGEAAIELGRYKTAQKYLQQAVRADSSDKQASQQLQTATLVLAADPFVRRISDAERNRRIAAAFQQGGDRLKACAQSANIDLPNTSAAGTNPPAIRDELAALWIRWQSARPQLKRLNTSSTDLPYTLMDLIFQIEQQTAERCGEPTGLDLALLRISRDREAVDR
jgi:tetratricopeptide (TPR) repeat protein